MRSRTLLALAAPVVALPLLHAFAQDQESPQAANRIHVRSRARVVAPADELELEIVVQGTAEEAREAEKKHGERLRRVLAALTGKDGAPKTDDDDEKDDKPPRKKSRKRRSDAADTLPTPGVPDEDGLLYEVREGRYTLGLKGDPNNMMEDPADDTADKKEAALGCGSCVHVTVKNLRKSTPKKVRRLIANVLDRAADAGAELGGGKSRLKPVLRFRVANPEALKKQAYADAIAKGKAHANDLAELAGRQLGKVSVLSESTDVPAQTTDTVVDYQSYLAVLQAGDPIAPDTSSGSSEIAVEVGVELTFELK